MRKDLDKEVILSYTKSKPSFKIVFKRTAKQVVELFEKFKSTAKLPEESILYSTETEIHILVPRKHNGRILYQCPMIWGRA